MRHRSSFRSRQPNPLRRTLTTRCLALVLLAASASAGAVVIRDDGDDARYRVDASTIPALVDMPGEGHGVLIAPRWVVTAAHAAPMQGMDADVTINGIARRVERVIVHPGYKRMPAALGEAALASGNPSRIHAFLAGSDDIAVVQLAQPVDDVAPLPLYRGSGEVTRVATLFGKGATGNGIDGQRAGGAHRIDLRRAVNAITGANDRYLWYRFDPPPRALPLEGVLGGGDSGGPLLIDVEGAAQLAGLGSWITGTPEHALAAGFYGQVVHNVRISRYVDWIDGVTCEASDGNCPPRP